MSVLLPLAPSETIFGPSISGDDVEQALLKLLKRWTGTYLADQERRRHLTPGALPRIRAWQVSPTFDKWPEDQLPAIIVVSGGLVEAPVRRGGGWTDARWAVGVGVVVSARSQQRTHELAMLYAAAVRLLVEQHPSLEGFAAGVRWTDEEYTQLDFDDQRTLEAGLVSFTVQVADVLCTEGGPTTPNDPLENDTDPWPEWPIAEHVTVDVNGALVERPLPPHPYVAALHALRPTVYWPLNDPRGTTSVADHAKEE